MANNRRFRWGKWLTILILLGLAGGGGYWYWQSRREAPTEYQTVNATRGNLTQVVTATGQLGPVVSVQVGSQISGIIRKIFVDYNSVVKSNQIIAEVDASTYKINVLRAQADLANAKANLTLSEAQAHRADSLFTNNLISASDHDIAIAQMEQAQAQVKSDEATLTNAEVQLSYCTIYAPVDGVVISRNVDVGQTVAASFNTPTLFVIANDLAKMEIDALVSEADIGGVTVAQDVTFSVDAYPYRTFRGKVNQVRYGAITNQNVINYDCVISVNNSDLKLLPGMTANVSIITAQRDDILKIPNAALRFRPPEVVAAETRTNVVVQAPVAGGGGRGGGDGSGRGGAFAQRGGGPGGGGGSGRGGPGGFGAGGERRGDRGDGAGPAGSRARPERQLTRTVYVLPPKTASKNSEPPKPQPVQVKVGITDGVSTEVLDGLEEGAQVVTGVISTGEAGRTGMSPNPFGGGFRRF